MTAGVTGVAEIVVAGAAGGAESGAMAGETTGVAAGAADVGTSAGLFALMIVGTAEGGEIDWVGPAIISSTWARRSVALATWSGRRMTEWPKRINFASASSAESLQKWATESATIFCF